MSNNFNVAILGYGLSGSTFHAPIINAVTGLTISHIYARNCHELQNKYPDIVITDDLNDILNDTTINLVINTLPNELHYSVSKQCLLAGKNLIVEKPFVTAIADGEELIKLAHTNNLLLSVYHNRRWDNGFLTLKSLLPQLGDIYLYEAYFDRFRPIVQTDRWKEKPAPGSGLLYDLGSHIIDQAINLFGMPDAIFADIAMQRQNAKVADYFNLTLFYANRRVVLGSSSMIAGNRPALAAYGNQGSYVKHGLDVQETNLRSGMLPTNTGYGIEDYEKSGYFTNIDLECSKVVSQAGNYCLYYQQIYQCLISQQNHPLPVIATDALNVIKLIELAELSNQQKQIIYLK